MNKIQGMMKGLSLKLFRTFVTQFNAHPIVSILVLTWLMPLLGPLMAYVFISSFVYLVIKAIGPKLAGVK